MRLPKEIQYTAVPFSDARKVEKKSVDNGKIFGALLTDLSKALNCLDLELLIGKLNINGFNVSALKLIRETGNNQRK